MTLMFLVLYWVMMLAPGRDPAEVAEVATAITNAAMTARPLYVGDTTRVHTAAVVTSIAFKESSFRNSAKSKTNDHCLMQVNARPDLARDIDKCLSVAIEMLRESMRMCPQHPIAFYASGPGACTNPRAQRISRDRMALAKRLLEAQP